MSNSAEYIAALEARMSSGAPFTYGMLCALPKPFGEDGRSTDKLIQKWRRKGLIRMDGRIGRAPRWVLAEVTSPSPNPSSLSALAQ